MNQTCKRCLIYLLCPGFYAGTTPALVAYVSENSVLFTALGYTRKFVARVRGMNHLIIIIIIIYCLDEESDT